MIIRKLTPEEWFRIAPIFAREFKEMPPPAEDATVVVAEEGGEIIAFGTVQMVAHVEPFWISDTHRGRYLIPLIINKIKELFPDLRCAFAYTRTDRMAILMEYFGMIPLDWKVFRWRK